ncbi:arylsulfatase B-like [Liolophura sinensis]|uniref:arylsulfatase B-like n=1 Tax=Liolophura sinensis TaxID=3198878 RepID=UPI00315867E1
MAGAFWELTVFILLGCASQVWATRPHIVFIVADDLGWNDVGWHNPAMITPNLDRLAREGVILNSSYVQPMCTPSRSAWMTGHYPFHTGMEHWVIVPTQATGLPQYYTLLPQRLKLLGYQTHMVGKWHLGFCDWGYTPTYRGFDSFLGYYEGMEYYYNHTRVFNTMSGVDFRENEKPADYNGTYSTHLFAKRAVDIISQTDPNGDPLFLYLPFQAVHLPLQVPKQYEDMYSTIHDQNRRVYCGMMSALDEAVGNITNALDKNGFLDNTIIIFTADNGGPTYAGANNMPLRGGKVTLWEGGTKGAAFVYSKTHLNKTGYVNTGMMHAVDWFPTILSAAGGVTDGQGLDGVDQWDMISAGTSSAREEFVYNIDPLIPNAAIRMGDYKLILGSPGVFHGWYPVPNFEGEIHTNITSDMDALSATASLSSSLNQTLLFNIAEDPTEHHDLSQKYPDIVSKLRMRLEEHWKSLVPPRNPPLDAKGDPANFGGYWTPGWC